MDLVDNFVSITTSMLAINIYSLSFFFYKVRVH